MALSSRAICCESPDGERGVVLATVLCGRRPSPIIRLKPIPADLAVLDDSQFFRGAWLILGYIFENGPIPLTPYKTFKRVLVN